MEYVFGLYMLFFGMKIILIFGVKVVKKVIKGEGGGMLNKSLIKLLNL